MHAPWRMALSVFIITCLICGIHVVYAFTIVKVSVSHAHAFVSPLTTTPTRRKDVSTARTTIWNSYTFQTSPSHHYYNHHSTVIALKSHEETEPSITLPKVTGITLKMAFDSNYAVADQSESKSERFTCPESLDLVHKLRRCSDAVLVGRSTVEIDDCTLTVRRVPLWIQQREGRRKPARVVIDPNLKLCKENVSYKVLLDEEDGYDTLIYHSNKEDSTICTYPNVGNHVQLIYLPSLDPKHIVQDLNSRGIQHIMVEGGPVTALKFLKEGMVDRAIFIRAPLRFIDPVPSRITEELMKDAGLYLIDTRASGDDTVEYWMKEGTTSWPGGLGVDYWPC